MLLSGCSSNVSAVSRDGSAPSARFLGGKSGIAAWSILLIALATFLLLIGWRGRLLHIDEVFYKAAGYHWSAKGTFAAPELAGRLDWDPPIDQVFACYPPVYPFVFGIYSHAVGFGWRQVAMFDALLHASLCLATAGLVLLMFKIVTGPGTDDARFPRWLPHALACVAGLVVLPLGTLGRPDELAMLFGMGALAMTFWRRGGVIRAAVSGVLWGLCAATSIGTAVVIAPVAAGIALATNRGQFRRLVIDALTIIGVSAVVFAACWYPLVNIHPNALRQFFEHSLANTHDYFTWLQAWRWAWGASTQVVLTMAGVTATALLLGVVCWRARLLRPWMYLLGGAMVGIVTTLAAAKGKGTYLWFVGPWMVGAILVVAAMWWRSVAGRSLIPRVALASLVLAPMLLATTVAGMTCVTQWLAVASLPSGQTPAAAEAVLVQSIPDGAVVLADDLWPHLVSRCKVYEATLGLADNPERVLDRVDYVALTANYSGRPGERRKLASADLEQYLADHFETVHDNAGGQTLTIMGTAVGSNVRGFGPVVLRRKPASWYRNLVGASLYWEQSR